MEPTDDPMRYAVVVNDEQQYAIWPDDREPPAGWWREGMRGCRIDCLGHIARVWTDMTPRSLREAYERDASAP